MTAPERGGRVQDDSGPSPIASGVGKGLADKAMKAAYDYGVAVGRGVHTWDGLREAYFTERNLLAYVTMCEGVAQIAEADTVGSISPAPAPGTARVEPEGAK